MTEYITSKQAKRLKDIDKILAKYNEIDIPDYIINKINNKFKSTKYYKFIRTEELELGMFIRYVDLSLSKISTSGIIVNIKATSNKKNGIITLYNPSDVIYWKINPDKYYIFEIEKGTNSNNINIRELYNNKLNQ
jgi:hypothetical protein